jgi:cytochrome oxidase Cu insertion factor (SCO1/SenC/PrrC family)
MRAFADVAFAEIIAEIDRLRAAPDRQDALAAMLAEQSPIYAGRSSNDAERLRGYLLASFETTGLPTSALPVVIEELENGFNPYVVAAAAKAIRGARDLPNAIARLLLAAVDRIRGSDDLVSFDLRAAPAAGAPVTALMELFRTLAWLGPRANGAQAPLGEMLERQPACFSTQVIAEIKIALAAVSVGDKQAQAHCCAAHPTTVSLAAETPPSSVDIETTELQDQDGRVFSFGDFFPGRPSVLTFFYSRCMNPNKCSLTITKLARLQQRIRCEGLQDRFNIAAVSYDPAFDVPGRLRLYGTDRGMSFDDRSRLLRTTGPFEPFQRWLDLGVGYGSITVNQHRLDMVILDDSGHPRASAVRVQWDEADVLAALKALRSNPVAAAPKR